MAQKTLQAMVVIGGKVDNTFGKIGDALVSMGGIIDGVSRKLIDFGKESIGVYQDYEYSMLDVEGSLSRIYVQDSQELHNVMTELDMLLSDWALNTDFHTDDYANAAKEAAQAGWNFEQMAEGIPIAAKLARAGGIDLSEAMGYILTSTSATGVAFDDLADYVDKWVYASRSVYGDVVSFGEAIDKMGATARLAGTTDDLFTLLAILHETGTQSSAAGTLLRNTLIRLVAPTQKAADVMAGLGISQEIVDEAMSETNGQVAEAVQRLEEMGFSAYDSSGNLRGFVNIFTDFAQVVKGMTDEERNDIIGAIFPTRTTTGALAFVNELSDGVYDLNEELKSGKATGFADYISELKMSGLTGSLALLGGKWENLQKLTGQTIAPDVENVAGAVGELIDKVSGMDSQLFSSLVAGLEVVAGAGPGLFGAGLAMKFLGTVAGSVPGQIALGALTVGALARAIQKYNDIEFTNKFGEMELDMEPIVEQLNGYTKEFNDSISGFNESIGTMKEGIEEYKTASTDLSSGIISKMVEGVALTEEDKAKFEKIGDDMHAAIVKGINGSASAFNEAMQLAAGDELDTNPVWGNIMKVMEAGHGKAIERAEVLSAELRKAMTSAFADDYISNDEWGGLVDIMEKQQKLLTAHTDAMARAKQEELLRSARTLGVSGMQEVLDASQENLTARIDEIDAETTSSITSFVEMAEVMRGDYINGELVDDAFIQQGIDTITEGNERRKAEARAKNYPGMIAIAEAAISGQPELRALDYYLGEGADAVSAGGMTNSEAHLQLINAGAYWSDMLALQKVYNMVIDAAGGADAVLTQAKQYAAAGDYENARSLGNLLLKSGIAGDDEWSDAGYASTQYVEWSRENMPMQQAITPAPAPSFSLDADSPYNNLSSAFSEPINVEVAIDGSSEAAAARGGVNAAFDSPIDVDVAFPNATANAAAAHSSIAAQFTPITQTVNIQTVGGSTGASLPQKAEGGRATEPVIFGEAGPEWFIPEERTPHTADLLMQAAAASGFTWDELAQMDGATMFADGGRYGGGELGQVIGGSIDNISGTIGSQSVKLGPIEGPTIAAALGVAELADATGSPAALNWPEMDRGAAAAGMAGAAEAGNTVNMTVNYSPTINAHNADGVAEALEMNKKELIQLIDRHLEDKELYASVVKY